MIYYDIYFEISRHKTVYQNINIHQSAILAKQKMKEKILKLGYSRKQITIF